MFVILLLSNINDRKLFTIKHNMHVLLLEYDII